MNVHQTHLEFTGPKPEKTPEADFSDTRPIVVGRVCRRGVASEESRTGSSERLIWYSKNKVTIHPDAVATSTIMLSSAVFDSRGIHGFPCGSGMGIAPGEGRKLPMRVSFTGEGWVSGPGFIPSGKPVKGAMCVLIEDGEVTVAYTH